MRLLFALLMSAIILLFPSTSLAQSSGNVVSLGKDEVVNKDYFASGNTVIISGTINGDAYIAGGNIIVEGTINGDLLAAGGSIDIRGPIRGNLRVAGGQITLSGEVDRNVSAAGGSINILSPAGIRGSLAAAGGSINLSSPTGKEANLAGGQITLSSRIEGDVNAAGPVNLTPQAQIAGNLTYWSTTKAQIAPEATVSGTINQNIPPQPQKPSASGVLGALAAAKFFITLMFLISYLLGGLLILKLTPFFVQRTTQVMHNNLWKSLGVGFLIVVVMPILIVILLLTVLGLPLAFILMAVYIVAIYFSKIVVSLALGQKILSTKTPTFWGLVVGLLVYGVLVIIPFFSWLVILIATSIGIGALYLERMDFLKEARAKKLM